MDGWIQASGLGLGLGGWMPSNHVTSPPHILSFVIRVPLLSNVTSKRQSILILNPSYIYIYRGGEEKEIYMALLLPISSGLDWLESSIVTTPPSDGGGGGGSGPLPPLLTPLPNPKPSQVLP